MTRPTAKGLATGDQIWFPNTYIAYSYILIGEIEGGAAVVLDPENGSLVAVLSELIESTGTHYNVSDRLYKACEEAILNGSYYISSKVMEEENLCIAA